MDKSRVPNPWLERRVFHWAHQGGAKEGPSNTIWAMRSGCRAGAQGLELDVHASADCRVVVIHDHVLHRTTDRSGWVADHTADELSGFDAAYWWVKGEVDNHDKDTPREDYVFRGHVKHDPEFGVPTLDAVLDVFPETPMTIEVKDGTAVTPLVELLRARQVPAERLIVTSFDDKVVETLRDQAPEFSLAPGNCWVAKFLFRVRLGLPAPRAPYVAIQVPHYRSWNELPRLPRFVRRLLPDWLRIRVATPRFVRVAHRAGMAVHVWTVDDEKEMGELIAMGVDGIMTDCPSVLAGVLIKRPVGSQGQN